MTKKYSVSIPWHCSVVVEVEAENAEEAAEKALNDVNPTLCHQCSDEVELGDCNVDFEPDVTEL